jgi:hypothetical protein
MNIFRRLFVLLFGKPEPCLSTHWRYGVKYSCSLQNKRHKYPHYNFMSGFKWWRGTEEGAINIADTEHYPNGVAGLQACRNCLLSETYWCRFPECPTKFGEDAF